MTIEEINGKRKYGDVSRVSELSGIPVRTIQDVIYGVRPSTTKRALEVIKWFSSFIECRENVKGE